MSPWSSTSVSHLLSLPISDYLPLLYEMPLLAFVSCRRPVLAVFGLCWPVLTVVGCHWLLWAFVGLLLLWLAFIGCHGPSHGSTNRPCYRQTLEAQDREASVSITSNGGVVQELPVLYQIQATSMAIKNECSEI